MQITFSNLCACILQPRTRHFKIFLQEPLALAQLQFEKFMALIENTVDLAYLERKGII